MDPPVPRSWSQVAPTAHSPPRAIWGGAPPSRPPQPLPPRLREVVPRIPEDELPTASFLPHRLSAQAHLQPPRVETALAEGLGEGRRFVEPRPPALVARHLDGRAAAERQDEPAHHAHRARVLDGEVAVGSRFVEAS